MTLLRAVFVLVNSVRAVQKGRKWISVFAHHRHLSCIVLSVLLPIVILGTLNPDCVDYNIENSPKNSLNDLRMTPGARW